VQRNRGTAWSQEEESVTVVATSSINGLVSRGLLKLTGTKMRVGHGSTPSYSRAQLTAAGREWLASAESGAQLLRSREPLLRHCADRAAATPRPALPLGLVHEFVEDLKAARK